MTRLILTFLLATASTTLFAQPVVTTNPKNVTNCINSCSDLTVKAVGDGLQYQWQMDLGAGFMNVSGAINDTFNVCDTGAAAPYTIDYRCVVINQNGDSATSLVATMSVDSCLPPIADFTYTVNDLEVCFTSTSQNAETLIWNFGNGKTNANNVTSPCSDYDVVWQYDVSLFAFNDHGSDSVLKTISLVGLDEVSSTTKIFPNPASDVLYIQSMAQIKSIRMFNINGDVVEVGSNRHQIDLSKAAQGLYTLEIETTEAISHKQIMVTR